MKNEKAFVFAETEGLGKTFDQSDFKPNQVSRQEIQQILNCFAANMTVLKIRENQIKRRKTQ